MQSQDRALIQVCHFLAGGEGAWTVKDMKDLAALQGTCKNARRISKHSFQERKPIAQAQRALMEDLAAYFDRRIKEEQNYWKYEEPQPFWQHPFTGEWVDFPKLRARNDLTPTLELADHECWLTKEEMEEMAREMAEMSL